MTQSYNTSHIKSARKNEKNSEKEFLDRNHEKFFSSKSTIKRASHDSAHFYLKLAVNLIKDKRVSNDCFRMLTLLLSKSDGWEIVPKVLAQELSEYDIGFNKTYDLISEAIALGYMKRETIKNGNLVIRYDYFVSEEPVFSNNSSAITGFVITEPVIHINNQELTIHNKNNTKSPPPKKPDKQKPKQQTPPAEAIIPLFSYEWRNKRTGVLEKIENGVSHEEFERLKILIGEVRIRSICKKMKDYAEGRNGTVRFKNKYLYKKILEWDKKASLAEEEKAQRKKEKALREGEKPMEPSQDRTEQYKKYDSGIIKKFINENPDLKDDIRLLDHKVELRNSMNKRIFGEIRLPQPFLKSKLEQWADEFRKSKRNKG